MLTITTAAADHLCSLLEEADAPDDLAPRIVFEEDVPSLVLDQPRAEDATFEHNGRTVLVLDEQASKQLSERTIDVEVTEKGRNLVFT